MRFIVDVIRCLSRILFVGIAAKNYSHVQYFKDQATYDELYGILLRVVEIGVVRIRRRSVAALSPLDEMTRPMMSG